MLIPGFIDTHVHIIGQSRRSIALENAGSIAEIQTMLRAKARELGPGEWITGYGWDEAKLADHRNLTRADLDAAAPANPVVLTRAGQHSVSGNSLALKLAGIDGKTPNPEHGLIEHGPDGQPNGILRERTDLLLGLVPPASARKCSPARLPPSRACCRWALPAIWKR
jgi:predicted amidohydrolase YtcJ